METNLIHALNYSHRGWKVLPLVPNGKTPVTVHGYKDATANISVIARMFANNPSANIGVATGETSGIVVIDIDVKNDVDGEASLRKLEQEYGKIPDTLTASTPNGGRHLFFKHPGERIGNPIGVLPGIDVRGDGGHIVVAPSVIDGRGYEWLNDLPPTEMPEWLIDIIKNRKSSSTKNGSARPDRPIFEGVPQGMRNDSVFRYACFLRAKGLSYEEAKRLVLEKAADCNPPLPEEEAVSCLDSAWKYTTNEDLTELGNARRLASLHGHRFRYVCESGEWMSWNGKQWLHGSSLEMVECAKDVVETIHVESLNAKSEERRSALKRHAKTSATRRQLENMIKLAQSEPGIAVSARDLDADPFLLGVRNGYLDLRTGEHHKPDRSLLLTKSAGVEYQEGAQCPRWLAFLDRVFAGDEALVAYLQRAIAYTLSGSTQEQCLFFLFGHGANGKTTLVNILSALLGDYAMTTPIEALTVTQNTDPSAKARLQGARLVCAAEFEHGQRMAESFIKQVTGGDKIPARFLYGKWFDFTPHLKLWITANHKPFVRGNDYAIWRRLKLIPFEVTIPPEERDPRLEQKLLAELPGVLNWAIDGVLAWQKHGLLEPDAVEIAVAEHKSDMDSINIWIAERCIRNRRAETPASALLTDYLLWAETNGGCEVSQKMLGSILGRLGYQSRRTNRGVLYSGIALPEGE